MILDLRPLDQAKGCILLESIYTSELNLKKGILLNKENIALLKQHDIEQVLCAKIETDDVLEDEAALSVASALAGRHVTPSALTKVKTGRCSLFADCDGLVGLPAARLTLTNCVSEAIGISTLPPYHLVKKGTMVATIKIIPIAVPKTALEQVIKLGHHLISVMPFLKLNTIIVSTNKSRTLEPLINRLKRLNLVVLDHQICDPSWHGYAQTLMTALKRKPDLIIIDPKRAIIDQQDLLPTLIRHLGGTVTRFGMPVFPGNLLLLGQIEGTRIVVMPACGRTEHKNGLDMVLERLAAGIDITRDDIASMGVGGLLTEPDNEGARP